MSIRHDTLTVQHNVARDITIAQDTIIFSPVNMDHPQPYNNIILNVSLYVILY